MRVAVVVAVHDAAAFLEQTLDSVLAQTYADWTVALVDDASTDGSAGIAQAYADRYPDRFRVRALDANVGVARARNLAVGLVPGAELVALLDHDDWLREDYLERMVALYDEERARGREIGIVGCDARLHTPEGPAPDTWGERTRWQDTVDLDDLIGHNLIFGRALFSRRAYDTVGGFSAECDGTDDYDLWLRILEAGYEVALTREPLAVYRLHPGALSRDQVAMAEAELRVYRRMVERDAVSRPRRRAVRRRIRRLRAVRTRWRVHRAWTGGRHLRAVGLALVGGPLAVTALLEQASGSLASIRRPRVRPTSGTSSARR